MSNQLKPVLCETESETNTVQSEMDNITVQPAKRTDVQQTGTEPSVAVTVQTQAQTTQSQKIFRQADTTFVPDFSDRNSASSVEIKSPVDDVQYHCITTRGDKGQTNPICRPETIENIIRKLDAPEESIVSSIGDDHKEYITKSKFSTLIGEMRVDILSMINLLSMLNKNASASNEEIQNIKRDICNLVNENTKLKEKVTKTKEDADKRLLHVCKTYNDKIDELTARIDRLDTEHNSTNDVKVSQDVRVIRRSRAAPTLESKPEQKVEQTSESTSDQGSNQGSKQNSKQVAVQSPPVQTVQPESFVTRQMSRQAARLAATQIVNQPTVQSGRSTSKPSSQPKQEIVLVKKEESEDESDEDSEKDSEKETEANVKKPSNSITDSNMDKNAAKFKVVPARSKRGGPDSFGVVEKAPEEPVLSGAFRQVARRDNVDNKEKVMTDTKTSRANRFGLKAQMSVSDKVSVKRR